MRLINGVKAGALSQILVAIALVCVGPFTASAVTTAQVHSGAAWFANEDEPVADSLDGAESDNPKAAPRPRGDDDASEDGTQETPSDGPSVTTPDDDGRDTPPGCPFRGGPLELFV
jgi:hypothetical protein